MAFDTQTGLSGQGSQASYNPHHTLHLQAFRPFASYSTLPKINVFDISDWYPQFVSRH